MIPSCELSHPGAVWLGPWDCPAPEMQARPNAWQERRALVWLAWSEPTVLRIVVRPDGSGWVVGCSALWRSERVVTRDEAKAAAERWLEGLVR